MIPAARIAAAIEVLADVRARRRPAADALKDWGLAHRFAGSGDRAAIADLLYDALRCKSSSDWIMGDDTPRAELLGALNRRRSLDLAAIDALFSGQGHAPPPLSDEERERLGREDLSQAPLHVRADLPEWLAPYFATAFGDRAEAEGRALAERAPLDLRVNLLKGDRPRALAALAHLNPQETPWSPVGLRIALKPDARAPALAGEAAYARGLVEVQDEGSQLAALLSGVEPGRQVLDLCAGAGGKTLALAAMMDNQGQIFATDDEGRRLGPIFDRLTRAGARNVQVRTPKGAADILTDLKGRCDLVFVDAPCSGSGAWRRNPDAKWRMRPGALEQRVRDQDEVLASAARYVRPGGRLLYVTCSLLREENEDRVAAFLRTHEHFLPLEAAHIARGAGLPALAVHASRLGAGLRFSPASTATDGFYIAALTRE